MTTTRTVPDISPGYPSKGAQLGPAWTKIWRALERSGSEFQDGHELAARVAKTTGLAPATLVALISRAAKAGLLEREARQVKVKIVKRSGMRTRTFYRIPEQ
jgi:hypothetical protein